MYGVMENLLWVPKQDLSMAEQNRIRNGDLNLVSENEYGEKKRIKLFEDLGDFLGVPRYYNLASRVSGRVEILDSTLRPHREMPPFVGELRDGQKTATRTILDALKRPDRQFGGILQAKCGTGKTTTALYLATKLNTPTVILMHKSDLMDQWKEAIEQFIPEASVGIVRGKVRDYKDKDFVLAMMQTINSQAGDLAKTDFFKSFGLCVLEECHHVPAVTVESVTRRFHAKIRLGLSATPRRKDGFDCVLFWHIGPILTVMRGVSLTGTYVQIPYDLLAVEPKDYRGRVVIGKLITAIASDPVRTKYICEQVVHACQAGRRVLVLTDRREHAQEIQKGCQKLLLAKGEFASVGLYLGQTKKTDLMEAAKKKIIVASFGMLSEGTDLPELDTVFLTTPRSDVEQMVGRIQRLCAGKKEPLVVDWVDKTPFCRILGRKRKSQFDSLGFKENQTTN